MIPSTQVYIYFLTVTVSKPFPLFSTTEWDWKSAETLYCLIYKFQSLSEINSTIILDRNVIGVPTYVVTNLLSLNFWHTYSAAANGSKKIITLEALH